MPPCPPKRSWNRSTSGCGRNAGYKKTHPVRRYAGVRPRISARRGGARNHPSITNHLLRRSFSYHILFTGKNRCRRVFVGGAIAKKSQKNFTFLHHCLPGYRRRRHRRAVCTPATAGLSPTSGDRYLHPPPAKDARNPGRNDCPTIFPARYCQ